LEGHTLAQPVFAMRQRGYRTKLGLKDVYTPQFVIDGRREAAGNHLPGVLRLVADAERTRWYGPPLGIDRRRRVAAVGVGPVPQGGAEVWMVRYDPRVITVRVGAGETRGAAVPHRNTVRELARLGPWTGQARVYPLPPPRARGLRTVVMVQGPGRYGVLAFARD
jgi:hypothetical protein